MGNSPTPWIIKLCPAHAEAPTKRGIRKVFPPIPKMPQCQILQRIRHNQVVVASETQGSGVVWQTVHATANCVETPKWRSSDAEAAQHRNTLHHTSRCKEKPSKPSNTYHGSVDVPYSRWTSITRFRKLANWPCDHINPWIGFSIPGEFFEILYVWVAWIGRGSSIGSVGKKHTTPINDPIPDAIWLRDIKGAGVFLGCFGFFCFSVWGTFPCYLLHLEWKSVICWIWKPKFLSCTVYRFFHGFNWFFCGVNRFSMVLIDLSMGFIDLSMVFIVFHGYNRFVHGFHWSFHGFNWFFHGFNRVGLGYI